MGYMGPDHVSKNKCPPQNNRATRPPHRRSKALRPVPGTHPLVKSIVKDDSSELITFLCHSTVVDALFLLTELSHSALTFSVALLGFFFSYILH